jgi:membrane glycosyltransferase
VPPPRTAILMPIYNEDSERVFAGLRAIHRSLAETGRLADFDFFILSDTRDPDVWVEEELRWQDMVRALDGKGRIFYRNRPENTDRKSGNLEDFCTRWGGGYRYMIVLDADSIMKGSTLDGHGAADGVPSERGADPNAAGAGQPRVAVCPHPASSPAASTDGCSPPG